MHRRARSGGCFDETCVCLSPQEKKIKQGTDFLFICFPPLLHLPARRVQLPLSVSLPLYPLSRQKSSYRTCVRMDSVNPTTKLKSIMQYQITHKNGTKSCRPRPSHVLFSKIARMASITTKRKTHTLAIQKQSPMWLNAETHEWRQGREAHNTKRHTL